MRAHPMKCVETYRLSDPGSTRGARFGAFLIQFTNSESNTRDTLRVIASDGYGEIRWDHVSVSLMHRCPTWEEMRYIKRLFFKPDEVVMQLHPADKKHINMHPYCLHLWRPHDSVIPLPPLEAV